MRAPSVRLLTPRDYVSMPWRNGRGSTLELLREDDAAGALLWRLSTADVVEDVAFSGFPGIARILMLVEGPEFDLRFDNCNTARVRLFEPVRFSGDTETWAENVCGRSRDLNFMAARDRFRADLALHTAMFAAPLASRTLLLALTGSWQLRLSEEEYTVSPDELLVIPERQPQHVRGEGTGLLVRMDLWPTSPDDDLT